MELNILNLKNAIEKIKIEVGNRWSDVKTSNTDLVSIFSKIDDGDDVISEEEVVSLNRAIQYVDNNSNKNNILETNEMTELQKSDFNFFKEIAINEILTDYFNNDNSLGFDLSANKFLKYIDILPADDLTELIKTSNSDEIFNNLFNKNSLSQEEKISISKKMLTKVANYCKEQKGINVDDVLQNIDDPKINNNPEILRDVVVDDLKSLLLDNEIKNVSEINEDNIDEVLQLEGDSSETSVFTSLGMADYRMTLKDKNDMSEKLMQKLIEYADSEEISTADIKTLLEKEVAAGYELNDNRLNALATKVLQRLNSDNDNANNILPNGKIDKDFEQGNTGDCWLLASIKAIALKPKGLKILNDSIKTDGNGNVKVKLKGVGKSYTFTQSEILMNNQMSSGDLDVRVIEMAIDKYLYEHNNQYEEYDLNGNNAETAYQILTGKECIDLDVTNENIDKFNQDNFVATVSTTSVNEDCQAFNSKQESIELYDHHAYTVVRSDAEYVYIINPHDTSEELKMTREDFVKFFQELECFEL